MFLEFPEKSHMHLAIGTVWAIVAALVGLKGINYVAKVATYLPLIPLVILLVLLGKTDVQESARSNLRCVTAGAATVPEAWT